MAKVTIHFVGDIVGPTHLVVDNMTDEELAEIQALWGQEFGGPSEDIVFLDGRTPRSGDFVLGNAIKVRSITAIDVDD